MNAKRNFIPKSVALIFSVMLVFVGCNDTETDYEASLLVEETTFAEHVFNQLAGDVDDLAMEAVSASGRVGPLFGWGMMRWGFSNCTEVTKTRPEEAGYPLEIVIDYGEGCSSIMHGIEKSGKIFITLTGDLREEGSQRIVTFEDYMVNGNQVRGTYTFTNEGNNACTITLEDGEIITEEGTITRSSTKIRRLIAGSDTEEKWDDVWEITGSANGTTVDGIEYSKLILDDDPLIAPRACFWIAGGTIVTTAGDTSVTIDFGDGGCDNLATRTINSDEPEVFEMNCRIHKWQRWKYWRR